MTSRNTFTTAEVAFIEQQRVARMATAGADGNPHVIPVCYACDGARFYTPLDEKPKRVAGTQLRRVRNITARPQVALIIDHYDDDDWSRLGYVLVEGHAELIAPDHLLHAHAVALLRARYRQYQAMALENSPVIMITPEQITSWGIPTGAYSSLRRKVDRRQ